MSEDYVYPVIMRSKTSGVIVEMTSHRKGKVVGTGHSDHKVGFYCNSWQIDNFKPYAPKIFKTRD